jgi:GMP synthase (glutamine-hydrolysing)
VRSNSSPARPQAPGRAPFHGVPDAEDQPPTLPICAPPARPSEAPARGAGKPSRLLVIEHGPYAPAGLLGDWAAARGLAVRTVALHVGEPLPAVVSGYGAAVSLGASDAAYDDAVPWLAAELSFLDRLLAAEVPVLGICFGAQALARVLGARLYRLDRPEIGWVRTASPRHAMPAGPWLSWHYDAFDLPAGATELAANKVSVQAFSLGPHTGVQFHPEATRPIAESWLGVTNPPPGVTDPLFRDADGAWERAADMAPKLFSAWLDGDLASAQG